MKNLIVKTLLFGSILNSLNMGIHNQSLNLINIDFRKKIFMDRNITKAIDNGFIFETNLENIKSKELFDLGYNNFVDKFCNNKDLFGFSEDNYSTYGTFSYFFSGNEDLIIENLKVLKYFTFENIEEQVKYSTTKLNIRDGADVSYNVIDTLGINEEVIVDGICSNGWFKIKLKDGRVGFVSNIYLSDTIVQEKIIPEEALILEKDTSYAFDIIGECKNISLMNTYYNSIPQNIRDYLTNIGWKYQLTTENIAQTVFNGQYKSVMGVSLGIEKIIKIEDRKNAIIDSVFHELGHALDWGEDAICSYSNTEELMNCWNTEKSILSSTFSVNSTNVGSCHEFFAECINQYFINNENFAKYCPLSFNYIQNVLSNF